MGWEFFHYVCSQPPSLLLASMLLPGSSCTHNPNSGWDPFSPPGEGLGHHHSTQSPSWPRRQVPLAHALSPEEARPFEQTCEGPPISPPFKNKHSLWLMLALTLARRGLSRSLCQSILCSLREERRWKKGFYLSGCLTSREGILLFLQSNPRAALKNISNLPDCSRASL